jgi:hypothetical protein
MNFFKSLFKKEKYANTIYLDGKYPFRVDLIINTEENRELFIILFEKIEDLLNGLKECFLYNYVSGFLYQKEVENLLMNFNFDHISENVSTFWNDDTSYVLEKKELHICTSYTENGQKKLHDPDVILYVLIHELAHLGCEDYGHTRNFWNFMKFLVVFSEENNILNKKNFENNPITYCDKILINQNF